MEHWNVYGILEERKKNTKASASFSLVLLSMIVRQGEYTTLLIVR
jgi:hypothetical protein